MTAAEHFVIICSKWSACHEMWCRSYLRHPVTANCAVGHHEQMSLRERNAQMCKSSTQNAMLHILNIPP